ncbi:MAG TPA: LLM class flavin-dependent oxidoreductase [Actinoplanes sp.]|nr:LLM class flavin-dependent oxidoreductase [Actinoplanes sp.]
MTEIWAAAVNNSVEAIGQQAARAEAAGFDGLCYSDSQNIRRECWVALTVAATVTSRLKLGTFVTNPVTRHPAVTASAAATLQEVSGGRVTLGVGRGDSSLAYLGYGPVPLARFARYLDRLQTYLRGEAVAFDPDDAPGLPGLDSLGYQTVPTASTIRWLPTTQPKVPVDVAGSGAKVIALAACLADGVTVAVGADLPRLSAMLDITRSAREAAGLSPAAFSTAVLLNVVVHPDRDEARRLIAGAVASMGRWSVMQSRGTVSVPDARTRAEFLTARTAYDMTRHMESGTSHAAALTPALIDRVGIAGPPDYCIERIRAVQRLGFDRLVIPGQLMGGEPSQELASKLLLDEVLPNIR